MVQIQLVRQWITRLFVSVLLMGFAVPSEAMLNPRKRGRTEGPDAAMVAAALVAALQMARNVGPQVLAQAMEQAAQVVPNLPEGLRNLLALAPAGNTLENSVDTQPEAPAAAIPPAPQRTPSRPKKGSKRYQTPKGSQVREDLATGRAIKGSPGIIDARNALYFACGEDVDFEDVRRHALQGRRLETEEIIELFERFAEDLVAANAFAGKYYTGRAKDGEDRVLEGHFRHMLNEDGQLRAEGFREMNDEGNMPNFHHLFEGAHPDQLAFLEGIAIMTFRATFPGNGLNAMRGSKLSRDFFSKHLKERMQGAKERGLKRRKEREECERDAFKAALRFDDSCSGDTKGSSGSDPEDDQDDSHNNGGGFGGSPQEPVSCEN